MKEKFAKLIDVRPLLHSRLQRFLLIWRLLEKWPVDQFMVIAVMIYTYFFTKKSDEKDA